MQLAEEGETLYARQVFEDEKPSKTGRVTCRCLAQAGCCTWLETGLPRWYNNAPVKDCGSLLLDPLPALCCATFLER